MMSTSPCGPPFSVLAFAPPPTKERLTYVFQKQRHCVDTCARRLVRTVLLEQPEVHQRRRAQRQRRHSRAEAVLCIAVELHNRPCVSRSGADLRMSRLTAIFCCSMYAALNTSLKEYGVPSAWNTAAMRDWISSRALTTAEGAPSKGTVFAVPPTYYAAGPVRCFT